MNKKNVKVRFIGPKIDGGPMHRHTDLTIDKIYEGEINTFGDALIDSDDIGEKSYMHVNEYVIVNDHDDIHKCVHTETNTKNQKRYVLIKL